MSLASEQPDGVAGLPFYGLHARHKSTEHPFHIIHSAVGEPEDVTKEL